MTHLDGRIHRRACCSRVRTRRPEIPDSDICLPYSITSSARARCVIEIEPAGEVVRLTITHEIDKPGSKLIGAVDTGWPKILSSLKTLLETGTALPAVGQLPRG